MTLIRNAILLSLSLPMVGSAQGDAKATTELEGRWTIKNFEINDASPQLLRLFHGLKPTIKKQERGGFLQVSGDKFFPLGKDKLLRESFGKIDSAKEPKTIDFSGTERFLKDAKFLAIYKLEGDELTLCVGDGSNRPTEFKANSGQILVRYNRTKAGN